MHTKNVKKEFSHKEMMMIFLDEIEITHSEMRGKDLWILIMYGGWLVEMREGEKRGINMGWREEEEPQVRAMLLMCTKYIKKAK